MAKKSTTAKAVIVKKEETTPIQTAKSTAEKYLDMAKNLKVATEEDYASATEILTSIKSAATLAELEKNKVLVPAKEVVKAETARWKPIENLFEQVNLLIRPKMKKFLDDKEEQARQELAKLQKQVDAGQIKKQETIDRKTDEIISALPSKTVMAGTGSSAARKIAKLKINDPALIPDEYWVIDEVKLRRDVVANDMKVPGAEKVWENSIAII